jgi:hypothetical protein
MKTAALNNSKFSTLIPNIVTKQPDYIWTSTPATLSLINVRDMPDKILMDVSIDGLNEHNFSLKIAGNILSVIVEKKKELTKKSTWGNISLIGNKERYFYTIFERSDIFLPGNEIKQLKSVEYDNGIVKIWITKKNIEMFE